MNTQRKQARNATIGRTYDAIRAYNAKRQAEYEAHLLTPEGEADRDARNNAMVRNMREQQTLDALRAIADKAHQLEARGLVDNVYAEVRERATNANLQFTTTQMHETIEQSNREYHALNIVRAELRAMVEEEELNDRIGLALFLNSVGQLRNEGIYEYMRSTVNPNASDAQIDAAIARYNAIFAPCDKGE